MGFLLGPREFLLGVGPGREGMKGSHGQEQGGQGGQWMAEDAGAAEQEVEDLIQSLGVQL